MKLTPLDRALYRYERRYREDPYCVAEGCRELARTNRALCPRCQRLAAQDQRQGSLFGDSVKLP